MLRKRLAKKYCLRQCLLEVQFNMQKRGQGSLEYLLIIGGGILVAVVIIGAIVSLAGTGTGGTKRSVANQTCSTYLDITTCEAELLSALGPKTLVASADECVPVPLGDAADSDGLKACCFDDDKAVGTRCYLNPEQEFN